MKDIQARFSGRKCVLYVSAKREEGNGWSLVSTEETSRGQGSVQFLILEWLQLFKAFNAELVSVKLTES